MGLGEDCVGSQLCATARTGWLLASVDHRAVGETRIAVRSRPSRAIQDMLLVNFRKRGKTDFARARAPGGECHVRCHAGSPRRLTGRCALFLALVLSLLAPSAATAQQGPTLTLIETLLDDGKLWAGNWTVNDGALSIDLTVKHLQGQFAWSVPPAQIAPSGFDMTLNVAGQVTSECAPLYAGTGASGGSFEITPDPARADVNLVPPLNCDLARPAAGSGSFTVHVTPRRFARRRGDRGTQGGGGLSGLASPIATACPTPRPWSSSTRP